MFSLKNSLLVAACVCLCTTLSLAQTSTTTLSSTVYDPSSAVVGGAEPNQHSSVWAVMLPKPPHRDFDSHRFQWRGISRGTGGGEIGVLETSKLLPRN